MKLFTIPFFNIFIKSDKSSVSVLFLISLKTNTKRNVKKIIEIKVLINVTIAIFQIVSFILNKGSVEKSILFDNISNNGPHSTEYFYIQLRNSIIFYINNRKNIRYRKNHKY